ncbi:D-tyrosyl-tRNA(Tyr) deacylase [Chromohalobacter marismortui]|uniref:D-aminoacyl-tRNA deacylase n=1 Tax=Chromohalobacter marismortui TaxID=42055 RepID=A0A4R7NES0_9GAMM|nr:MULTISPECIES: D-aminoacyl-tRNA deacylase [Chromohalobacter]MCI0510017.1 D-aminoacyl-tRNA deacylase [Chromohalobacter sp.]MCI0593824.1 D-aminoacyl-tRNA deacylase [Chromohalobacter sp.]TDU19015.1 D-tyrosyl-tRNA(Tyr) deacylase [Chromohalobacter marismortui]
MRAVIQRVSHASVDIDDRTTGAIDQGVMALIGVAPADTHAHADKMLNKLLKLRLFSDEAGKMNLNVQQVEGGLLLVPQFTLMANTAKGLRPGFDGAATPAHGEAMFDYLVTQARQAWSRVATGEFGADMHVSLLNDGPVTFIVET